MTASLSILCVTKVEPHAERFTLAMYNLAENLANAECVVALDSEVIYSAAVAAHRVHLVRSKGYIESVLDEALGFCTGDYVLRLDDDESASPAMVAWLKSGEYHSKPHWKFPRANLWGDGEHFIVTPQLWPDVQTRLSRRELAGGRNLIHAGSPHGGGTQAPCAIEHHKFLVKSLAERREIVRRYDSIQPGAGTSFAAFSVPEDAYDEVPLGRFDESGGVIVDSNAKFERAAA